jgi:hypothetical protein
MEEGGEEQIEREDEETGIRGLVDGYWSEILRSFL